MRKNNGRIVRGAAAIATLAAFGTLTACSTGGTAMPGSDATPSSSTAKQTPTTGARVTGGADALKGGGKLVDGQQFCTTALVGLGADFPVQGAADQLSVPILLTNDSAARCTIQGFPGVQFRKDNGQSWDLDRGDDPIKPVILAPGESTSATLVFLRAGTGQGTSRFAVESILITPPNTTDTQQFTWDRGAIVLQDGATHPGTYVRAVDAVDYGNK